MLSGNGLGLAGSIRGIVASSSIGSVLPSSS